VLDRIPGRDKLQARVAAHTGGGVLVSQVQTAGGRIFYLRRAPSENTYKRYVREQSGADRLLVDPDRDAKPGQHFNRLLRARSAGRQAGLRHLPERLGTQRDPRPSSAATRHAIPCDH